MIDASIDTHVNTGPCLLPRIGTAVEMARSAAAAGVAGWVLKSHHESTVGRAAQVESAVPGFRCAGGVVLNEYVGGVNPAAVRGAMLSGGRFAWFPTLHAENHVRRLGKGRAGVGTGDPAQGEGLRATDTAGNLSPASRACIDAVRAHGGIVGTGHVGPDEIEPIVDYCTAAGVPVLINHPYFVVEAEEAFFAGMARKGAWIEICAASVMPVHPVATLDRLVSLARACGIERCLLASDGGSVQLPSPSELVRTVAMNLVKHGLVADEVRRMTSDNPRRLLGWT